MKFSLGLSMLLFASPLAFSQEQSDPRLEKWLDQSQKIFQSNHLIAYVRLAHIDSKKGPPFEFRYDRYPEGIERVQKPDGSSLARTKGKPWLVSDDWGETGEKVDPNVAKQTEGMIGYVDIPLSKKHESKDKSQGADVIRVVDQRKTDEGNEEIVFERGREHQNKSLNYPKYTFFRYKNAQPDDVILSKFSGPIYTTGGDRVQLDVRYDILIAVKVDKVNIATPPPSLSAHP